MVVGLRDRGAVVERLFAGAVAGIEHAAWRRLVRRQRNVPVEVRVQRRLATGRRDLEFPIGIDLG